MVVGKWLLTRPKILIMNEPTRGIDVGAKLEIYNIVNTLAQRGIGIIFISSEFSEILGMMRGVGPLIATALVATIGDGQQYRKGRDMAAALGLTPKQHSSGGKDRLLGISKRGDAYLRCLLVHGARSAMRTAKGKEDQLSRWIIKLQARRHANVAAVALANKMARMAWVIMARGEDYNPERSAMSVS